MTLNLSGPKYLIISLAIKTFVRILTDPLTASFYTDFMQHALAAICPIGLAIIAAPIGQEIREANMFRHFFDTLAIISITALGGGAHALTAVDIAGQVGMPAPLPTQGESVVANLFGDGKVEIVLSGHGQEWPVLQQGAPGRFSRTLSGAFASGQDRHGCTMADFNGDGRPDVYCVRGACKGICTSSYPNELYLQGNGIFAKFSGAWGADDPHGRGRGAVALDYDNDSKLDLLVVNEKSTKYPTIGNHLYHNVGSRFAEVTGTPVKHTIGTMSAVVIPKPTGYPDVALETTNGVIYYKNNNGSFASGITLSGTGTFDVDAGDLNGDGKPDLVIVRGPRLELRLNDGNYNFPRINYTRSLTQGRDVALCDLDGRSGLDIYVAQGARPANQDFVLLNSGSGTSFTVLSTPRVAKGHGDIATCVPGIPGGLGAAVLVTNGKWMSAGNPDLGPTRLIQLKP